MSSIIKRIEYFKTIFTDVELNIRSKISDEIEEMFLSEEEYGSLYKEPSTDDLLITLKVLEDALKDAKKDLKDAKKNVKRGTMDEDDLYSYKCAVDEILQQIKEIKSNLND